MRRAARRSASKARAADRQGLPRVPGCAALLARLGAAHVQVHARSQLHRQHRAQRVGLLDHLLRALPRPDVHVQRGGGRRTRRAAAGTCASCSAPRTSTAARCFTCWRATSASRSSTTSSRTCPRAATPRSPRVCANLPPLRPALQHGPAAPPARHGAPDDPAPRVPRRQARAAARALSSRRPLSS